MKPSFSPQDRREIQLVVLRLLVPVAVGFCAAVLLVRYNGKSVWKLVNDPAAAFHSNPLIGFLSNVGIIAWCAAAAISLFAAWILLRARAPRDLVAFHAAAGAFTSLLMVDDFFLIHDHLAPRYLGLPQNAVYAIYALLFLVFLWRFRRELLERNPALFVVAVGLLAFMAGIDAIGMSSTRLLSLAMSGSKLLGLVAWGAYFALAARRDIEAHSRR